MEGAMRVGYRFGGVLCKSSGARALWNLVCVNRAKTHKRSYMKSAWLCLTAPVPFSVSGIPACVNTLQSSLKRMIGWTFLTDA